MNNAGFVRNRVVQKLRCIYRRALCYENDLADKKGGIFKKIRKKVEMVPKIEIVRRKTLGMHHQRGC